MDTKPPEYIGEFEDAPLDKSGSWFFDLQANQLVYIVISADSNKDKLEQLRYQLQFTESEQVEVGHLHLRQMPYKTKENKYE